MNAVKEKKAPEAASVRKAYKSRSTWGEAWHRLTKNKGAMISLAWIVLLIALALFADVIFDYEADIVKQNISQRFTHPNWKHPFGTDNLGRDLFKRMLYGAKYSLPVGLVATGVSVAIGTTLGAIAGFFGGLVENIIMRFLDIFDAIPGILTGLILIAMVGTGQLGLMITLGIVSVPAFARTGRMAVLMVRNNEFVESAYAIGCNHAEVIFGHVVPNGLSPILVQISIKMGSSIIAASSYSYIGLGIDPPTPEWGALLSAGRAFMIDHSYLTTFPGLFIMIAVIAFNQLGDGIRDAMDPKTKR